MVILYKPGWSLGRVTPCFLFNLTDCSLPAPLLQHFCNDSVRVSGNWSSCKLVQGKKLLSSGTTDLFQGPNDWKETQEADVAGLQDPAALLWGRQDICKKLSQSSRWAQDSDQIWTNLLILIVAGPIRNKLASTKKTEICQFFLSQIVYFSF